MKFESNEALAAYLLANPNLADMVICDSPGLTSLPDLPSSLTYLAVYNCSGLTSLPTLPGTLTCLVVTN
jgi:hypothetical protein